MTDVLAAASAELDALFATLDDVAARARAVLGEGAGGTTTSDELERIDPRLVTALGRHAQAACGLGLVLEPGRVQGRPRWLQWYWQSGGRPPARLRVTLDPEDPEFYDYTAEQWYRRPFATGERAITGPYVDYICSNEYVFTLAAPIRADGGPVGIAGADVRASHIERLLAPALLASPSPTVVTNADGRIIAGNIADAVPGNPLHALHGTWDAVSAQGADDHPATRFWSVCARR